MKNCPVCGYQKIYAWMDVFDQLVKTKKRYNVKKCGKCGLFFVDPQPKNLSSLYPEEKYVFYSEKKNNNQNKYSLIKPLWRLIIRIIYGKNAWLIKNKNKQTLLDIGCASGDYLKQMENTGWEVTGVEPSKKATLNAKKLGLMVINSTFEKAKIKKKFDLITLRYVIEHFKNPIQALKKANKMIKPNGVIILSTPNTDSVEFKIFKQNWGAFEVPRHLFLFNKKNIKIALEKSGLEPIKFENELYPASTIIGIDNLTKKKFSKIFNSTAFLVFISPIYSILGRIFGTGRMIITAKKINNKKA
jgi:2-polyprenyl-3-methyl-5-hydroxy-6-metoxy-1,4-benzoquinol methylase